MRSLLGGTSEVLVNYPGAKGPEGEGEAAMTMMVLVYLAAAGILIYGAFQPTLPIRRSRSCPVMTQPRPELHPRDQRDDHFRGRRDAMDDRECKAKRATNDTHIPSRLSVTR